MIREVLPDRRPDRAGAVAGDDLDVEGAGRPLVAEEPIELEQRFVDAETVQVEPRIVAGRAPPCSRHP